jgi:hypothetical protein
MFIYQDLPNDNSDNPGGLYHKLLLLPADSKPYPWAPALSYSETDLDAALGNLTDFVTIGIVRETSSYESGNSEKDGADVYTSVYKGIAPKVRLEGTQVLSSFVHNRCLAVIEDRNGNKRVLGRMNEPAVLKFKESTGERFDSLNSYEIQISITSSKPPAFILPE